MAVSDLIRYIIRAQLDKVQFWSCLHPRFSRTGASVLDSQNPGGRL